jgi:serine/threonine-protein kinase RsbW
MTTPQDTGEVRQTQMTVPGRYDCVAEVCEKCAEVAREAGLDEDAVFHVEMAVDEACTNIIKHAYGGEDKGTIEMSCCVDDEKLIVTLHDHGQEFDPSAVPPPKVGGDVEEVAVGGLGLYFMRKLMDEVHFEFDPRTGNTLTMVKHTNNRGPTEDRAEDDG